MSGAWNRLTCVITSSFSLWLRIGSALGLRGGLFFLSVICLWD
jgi:hypothetical protein